MGGQWKDKSGKTESHSITYLMIHGERAGVCFLEMCWYHCYTHAVTHIKWFFNELSIEVFITWTDWGHDQL